MDIEMSKLFIMEYEETPVSRGEKMYLHLGEWPDEKTDVTVTENTYSFKIMYDGEEYVLDSMRLFGEWFKATPNETLTLTLTFNEVENSDLVRLSETNNTKKTVCASLNVYYIKKWKSYFLSLVVDKIGRTYD